MLSLTMKLLRRSINEAGADRGSAAAERFGHYCNGWTIFFYNAFSGQRATLANCYSVLGGKMDNIYDVLERLKHELGIS